MTVRYYSEDHEGFDSQAEFMNLWDELYPGLDWCWRIEFRRVNV